MFPSSADKKLHQAWRLGYDGRVSPREDVPNAPSNEGSDFVRDPLAARAALLAARQRSMSERLELALSWNAVAAELRAGVKATTSRTHRSR